MRRGRFTEDQIVGVPREHEAGVKTADLCRKQAPMAIPQEANQRWSLEFVSDSLACGRRFRLLNVIDDYHQECLACIPSLAAARQLIEVWRTDYDTVRAHSSLGGLAPAEFTNRPSQGA